MDNVVASDELKKSLKILVDEYLATLDNIDASMECWGITKREFAENELEPFLDWVEQHR